MAEPDIICYNHKGEVLGNEFDPDIRNNRGFLPNYSECYRQGETISTAFVESAVNQAMSNRLVKKGRIFCSKHGPRP